MKSRRLTLGLLAGVFLLAGIAYLASDRPSDVPAFVVEYNGPTRVAPPAVAKSLVSSEIQPTSASASVVVEVAPAKQSKPMSLDGAVVVPTATVAASKAAASSTPVAPSTRPKFEAAADVTDERLAEAAAYAKMDFAEFKKQARQDRDLKVDSMNRPFYVCEGLAAPSAAPSVDAGDGSPSGAKIPAPSGDSFIAVDAPPATFTGATFAVNATTAFQLHSRPGAAKVIYLDFNGHTTLATSRWANTYTGGTAFTTPAFKLNGTGSPTDQVNLDAIRDIWYRVSEDYAAWDVDVTTEQPPVTAMGQRCVIGGNWNDWLHTSCGGISHFFSFGGLLNGSDEPNFVFVDGTGSSVNGAQVAISHEVGHSVGLTHMGEVSHDAVAAKGYSSGHTVTGHTGVSSCGPIMGACYGVPLVQWSKGDYPYPNNTQDEIATIGTYITPRTGALDDHGNTMGAATVIAGTSLNSGGIIATSSDVDLFKVGAGVGPLTVSAIGSRVYPDVKLCLQLLDSAGTVVASNYTATSMASALTYNVSAKGTYYIKAIGVGFDTATPTYAGTGVAQTVVGSAAGWTNYGSLGRYTITGSWNALFYAPVAVINSDRTGGLRPVTVVFNGSSSSDFDGTIASYSWNFGDVASGTANTSTQANPTHIYSGPPGNYTATLTVTDNEGNVSAPATRVITVSGAALPNSVRVASMTGSWARMTNVEVAGTAVIQVVNQYGQPLRSVAVYVRVTGSAAGSAAAKTDLNGYVTIQMPKQRMTNPSTYTFSVTSLVYPAYTYNVLSNVPSPASVTISR
jgi:PKD repeat protein